MEIEDLKEEIKTLYSERNNLIVCNIINKNENGLQIQKFNKYKQRRDKERKEDKEKISNLLNELDFVRKEIVYLNQIQKNVQLSTQAFKIRFEDYNLSQCK